MEKAGAPSNDTDTHSDNETANDMQVRIYDLYGRLITEKTLNGTIGEISTKDWSSGLYILQLWHNGEMIDVEKILKE